MALEFLMGAGPCLIALLASALLCGCASHPDRAVQYLDEDTAATITGMSAPWVFAHDAPELAVHSRDYIDLRAVDVNRTGSHQLYLQLDAWSTLDFSEVVDVQGAKIEIRADDRLFALRCSEEGAAFGIGGRQRTRGKHSRTFYCPAERSLLEFLIVAAYTQVRVMHAQRTFVFESWRDGRSELRAFVNAVR